MPRPGAHRITGLTDITAVGAQTGPFPAVVIVDTSNPFDAPFSMIFVL
jgi:hypothetical protein